MKPRRKILLLADESPFDREKAPLARRQDRVLDALVEAGWDTCVVTVRSSWKWHDRLRSRGIGAYTLTTTRYSHLPLAAWRLSKIVRRESPAIIHALGPFCALISGSSRFFAKGPIRVYDRSHVSGRPRLNLGSRVAARLNDHTIARSEAVREAALALDRTDPSRITVAFDGAPEPRSVSSTEVTELRGSLSIPEGAPVVGIVARLRPEKGHLTLLEAMRALGPRLETPPHLLIVGAGPYEDAIREAIGAHEPFVTHLVGYREDIAPWLALSDIVAIPSYQDASPKVAAEALAAGRPVVASNVGGLPEQIVDGAGGVLVPPARPEALADAIYSLLLDPVRRRRLGEAGRATYQTKFTLEQRTERWMRCYRDLLAAAGQAPR